jgi:hypothetical protein
MAREANPLEQPHGTRGGAMINSRVFVALAALVFLSACTSAYEPTPKTTALDAEKLISNTASVSGTLIVHPKDRKFICTQPPPDAAFSQGESGNLSVNIFASQSEGSSEEEETTEIEMAGRTPAVLLARELLYRLCEFGHNYTLDKTEASALYEKNLELISKISGIEAGNTKVTIGDKVTTTETLSNAGEGAGAAGIVKASAASKNWEPKKASPSPNPTNNKINRSTTTTTNYSTITNESDCVAVYGTWSDSDDVCSKAVDYSTITNESDCVAVYGTWSDSDEMCSK